MTALQDDIEAWGWVFVGCKLGRGDFEDCVAAFDAAAAHGVDLSGSTMTETFVLLFHPEAALMAPGDLAGALEMVLGGSMVQAAFTGGAGEMPLGNKPAGKSLVGSGLKTDLHHGWPRLVDTMATAGRRFTITNRSGLKYDLWQVEGHLNGKAGIYEWIVDVNAVSHRRFIEGGTISGYPNQVPKK